MPTSLLTERLLVFQPAIAEAIGLEDAVMLSCCYAAQRLGAGHEPVIAEPAFAALLPFWSAEQRAAILRRMEEAELLSVRREPHKSADGDWQLTLCAEALWSEPMPMPAVASLSPSVAATLGLDGAVLLSFLDELQRYQRNAEGRCTLRVSATARRAALPFWDLAELRAVARDLEALGVLTLLSSDGDDDWEIALQEDAAPPTAPAPASVTEPPPRAAPTVLPLDWEPDEATLSALAEMGVDEQFIGVQRLEFKLYWRERGETRSAWNSRFFQRVQGQWELKERDAEKSHNTIGSYERLADRSWAH